MASGDGPPRDHPVRLLRRKPDGDYRTVIRPAARSIIQQGGDLTRVAVLR
jgi:hypothetical protein